QTLWETGWIDPEAKASDYKMKPGRDDVDEDGIIDPDFTRGEEFGFIAQELNQVMPSATRVKTFDTEACSYVEPNQRIENKTEEFMAVDYTRLIPVLTRAVQEQQQEIADLKEEVQLLKDALKDN
ncbi:MAG: hypothetical protein AAF570_25100, partial [Bacteroidota bacterium]